MAYNTEKGLTTFHLFSGDGGGILADLLLGHTPVGACEIEKYPREVLLARQRDGMRQTFQIKSLVRKNHGDGNLSEQLARVMAKKLTPNCAEILMRWPDQWSDLKPLETGKIQSWHQQHSQFSQKD